MNSCGALCFACALQQYSKPDNPRAFCVSNWSHAAGACTRGIRAGGFIRPISVQWELVVGGATSFRSQSEPEPRAARPRLRVPDTRELEQLLYAGRQRAEAFLSPEKTAHSRFLWITSKLESHAALPDYYRKPRLCSNLDRRHFEPLILNIIKLVICDVKAQSCGDCLLCHHTTA